MATMVIALMSSALAAQAAAMTLASQDLKDGAPMPALHVYTRCGGGNLSPQLSWSGAPAATKSFAVTMIDHSVPPTGWSHWIVVNLPPSVKALPRGAKLPAGARALVSDFGDAYYDGPCPPAGSGVHLYAVTVWALPTAAALVPASGSAKSLEAALARAALDHATISVTAQTR